MSVYLIEGGNTQNKGAEAMLYITIQEIRNRDAEAEVMVSSSYDYKKGTCIPGVEIVEESVDARCYARPGIHRMKLWTQNTVKRLLKRKFEKNLRKSIDLLQRADYMVDISGFTLASKWDDAHNLAYLYAIYAANQRGVKIYLMPQSYGPFEYKSKNRNRILNAIKEYLPLAEIVYAREYDGVNLLKDMAPTANIRKSVDLVLQSTTKIDNVVIRDEIIALDISKNSVCVIPNTHCLEAAPALLSAYQKAINYLLSQKKKVYLLAHSTQDYPICEKIKEQFVDTSDVIFIHEDLSCFEYQFIVSKFDYVIASRYHSIVHAYKEGVPCVVVGWAVKYKELTELFHQSHYMLQANDQDDVGKMLAIIKQMEKSYAHEKEVIQNSLKQCQKDNCFDCFRKDIKHG